MNEDRFRAVTILHDIALERAEQIDMGYTQEHDDEETMCQLAIAAACYATSSPYLGSETIQYPWEPESWKPGTYRDNLIKAAALIVAEIERLDRIAAKKA